MEKPKTAKGARILNLLPKATTFSISNPPRRAGAGHWKSERGFSGPIISIIPKEVRHRKRSHGAEPASPKISCMGQIKHKKKSPAKPGRRPFGYCAVGRMFRRKVRPSGPPAEKEAEEGEKQSRQRSAAAQAPANPGRRHFRSCAVGPMIRRRVKKNSQPAEEDEEVGQKETRPLPPATAAANPAPGLGHMRRFASRREALAGFDWRKVAPAKENSGEEEEEELSSSL